MSGERGARRPGDHGAFDELAVGWALHSLEPEDETLFVLHLPDCARCARTVAETSEVMAALAIDLAPAEPSAQLRDRLRAAVDVTDQVGGRSADQAPDLDELDALAEQVEQVAPARRASGFPHYEHRPPVGPPAQPAWRRLLPSSLVAAAVAAILGLGTWNVMISEARNSAEAAASQQADVVNQLLQPGQATIAPLSDKGGHRVATVVVRPASMQVVTDGLAVNDVPHDVYVLWGMRDNAAVALGTFDVVRSQTDLRLVGSDETGLDGYRAYAISLERGRQAPRTPSAVLAQGQVTS